MPSSPPSEHPLSPSLRGARGTLREAVGALLNLDQLLRSIRVAPKAIAAVLPDVYAACGPMREAMTELIDARAALPETRLAAEELRAFVLPRLSTVESALANAKDKPVTAKQRLSLERTLGGISPEFDAVRELLDLLDACCSEGLVRLDLADTLDQALKTSSSSSQDAASTLATELRVAKQCEIETKPWSMMAMTRHALSWVAHDSGKDAVRAGVDSGCKTIVFDAIQPEAHTIRVVVPRTIEPTLTCLQAAARALAFELKRSPAMLEFGRASS